MKRRFALLAGLLLAALRLTAVQIEPDSWYRAVTAQDKPSGWSDGDWKVYVDTIRNLPETSITGNSVVITWPKTQGKGLLEYLDPNSPFNRFLPARLVSAEKIPSPGESAKAAAEKPAPPEDPLAIKAAPGNGPLSEADQKGKPVYYAGSPEAKAQMQKSAKEQDEAVARFKKSGAPGNGPVSGEGLLGKPVKNTTGAFSEDETFAQGGANKSQSAGSGLPDELEDKRPLSQRIMNTGTKSAPRASGSLPTAAADEADDRPVAATGNKFAKQSPPRQGTKKDDTLFKNQNQNGTGQFMAPDNYIAIWAHPQDRGTGAEQDRLVLVELTDSPKPVGMTLWQAKNRKYVPPDFRYSSLRVYPQ